MEPDDPVTEEPYFRLALYVSTVCKVYSVQERTNGSGRELDSSEPSELLGTVIFYILFIYLIPHFHLPSVLLPLTFFHGLTLYIILVYTSTIDAMHLY